MKTNQIEAAIKDKTTIIRSVSKASVFGVQVKQLSLSYDGWNMFSKTVNINWFQLKEVGYRVWYGTKHSGQSPLSHF